MRVLTGRIGEMLLEEQRITPEQLQEALTYQQEHGVKLGTSLVKLGFLEEDEVTTLLSRQYGVPSIKISDFEIDESVIQMIPAETASQYQIIPLCRSGSVLTIAMADSTNVFAMDDVKFMTGCQVEPAVASEGAVLQAIRDYYGVDDEALEQDTLAKAAEALEGFSGAKESDVEVVEDLEEIDLSALTDGRAAEAPVIRLVNLLLMSALQKGASDIHIEPYERESRIRFFGSMACSARSWCLRWSSAMPSPRA